MNTIVSEILTANGSYTPSEAVLFEAHTTIRPIAKDRVLISPGDVCKSIFYAIEGAFYQYNFINEDEENILDLHLPGEWFLDHKSFISQNLADSYIKAHADGVILELPIESLHHLIAKSPAFLQIGRILEQATARVHFFDNRLTPAEKYQYVLQKRANLLGTFPLKLIASYLKITPETLSRVRETSAK